MQVAEDNGQVSVTSSPRVAGVLTTWNDERGFGFVTIADTTRSVFVHISSFPKDTGRPQVGDALTFEVGLSPEGKPRATAVQTRRVLPPRSDTLVSYLAIFAFVALVFVLRFYWGLPFWVVGLYVVVSVITYLLYAADKRAASAHTWRIPERSLVLLGIIGGWPGAIFAQQRLRHKTHKRSFRIAFWLSVIINVGLIIGLNSPGFAGLLTAVVSSFAR